MYLNTNAYECFLDDFRIVTIESLNPDQGFFIVNEDNEFIPFRQIQVNKKKKMFIITLEIETAYHFRKQYYVFNNNGRKEIIKERYVITKPHFEDIFYYDGPLGFQYSKEETIFTLWAPISKKVKLCLHQNPTHMIEMDEIQNGVFQTKVQGDLDLVSYSFLILNHSQWLEVNDPYAITSLINSGYSVVIDLNKTQIMEKRPIDQLPINQSIIYEMHVRDFTINPAFPFKNRGKFLGIIEQNVKNHYQQAIGLDYLIELGISHIQLLPIFDFSSVTEFHQDHNYNWGYDPEQHSVIEGRYATQPTNPYNRIEELKFMIQTLKDINIGVIMDVVYNHVFKVDTHVLNQILPYYFFRLDKDYQLFNGSACGNDLASEKLMCRRFIIDSMSHLLKTFHFNGFRLDLMGLMDRQTMLQLEKTLRAIHPNVYLYGEGWKLNIPNRKMEMTIIQEAKKTPTIGYFNDQFRDIVKGDTFKYKDHGIASGSIKKRKHASQVLSGHVDSLFTSSSQSINYISCHDNHTLYDRLSLFKDTTHLISYQKQCYAYLLLSQGIPFLHAGCEFSRTKNGLDNSYNKGDDINQIDWDLLHTNQELVQFVKNLIHLRKTYPFFNLMTKQDMTQYLKVHTTEQFIELEIKSKESIETMKVYFNITPTHQIIDVDPQFDLIDINHHCERINHDNQIAPYEVQIFISK